LNSEQQLFFAGQKIVNDEQQEYEEYELLLRYGNQGNARFPAQIYENLIKDEKEYKKYIQFLKAELSTFLVAKPNANFSFNIDQQELKYQALFDFLSDFPVEQRQRLTIELTENAPLEHELNYYSTYDIDAIKQIADMDYKIAFDDIGSGNNTLGNLFLSKDHITRVKWSYINLAKFVSWEESRNWIKFLNEITTTNQLDLVIEGVENEDVAQQLRKLGIKYFQGYLYSKPTPLIG
jgi:EAL domain-containing protein (putative c-di-GMP-specific phosphodiesterase class I)